MLAATSLANAHGSQARAKSGSPLTSAYVTGAGSAALGSANADFPRHPLGHPWLAVPGDPEDQTTSKTAPAAVPGDGPSDGSRATTDGAGGTGCPGPLGRHPPGDAIELRSEGCGCSKLACQGDTARQPGTTSCLANVTACDDNASCRE